MRRIYAINKKVRVMGGKIYYGNKNHPLRGVYEVWTTLRNIDSRSLDILLRRRKLVYIFDRWGFRGLLLPFHTSYGLWSEKMTIAQARAYEDRKMRLRIAKEIVGAIMSNISAVFHRYIRKSVGRDVVDEFRRRMRGARECLKNSADDIMLCEARAWRSLFYVLGAMYPDFRGRIRRPPSDPLNALISYINSLLYAQCLHAILLVGLDPMISFVHEPSPRRRFSLPLDIKDIFMPYITIRLAVKLRNRWLGREKEFFVFTERRGRTACYLNFSGRKIVVWEFRRAMRSRIGGDRLYNIIVREVEKLGKFIVGGSHEYRAWRL